MTRQPDHAVMAVRVLDFIGDQIDKQDGLQASVIASYVGQAQVYATLAVADALRELAGAVRGLG